METIRRIVMFDRETEEEFLASPFPDSEDYYGGFVSDTCQEIRSVNIAICTKCGKPFDLPSACDEIYVVDNDSGVLLIHPEWYSEHEQCDTVWAGFDPDPNVLEPGEVYTNAVAQYRLTKENAIGMTLDEAGDHCIDFGNTYPVINDDENVIVNVIGTDLHIVTGNYYTDDDIDALRVSANDMYMAPKSFFDERGLEYHKEDGDV